MKVLFAVNNDSISDSVVKKYQKDFREIISYKNVYYFNAILKELQKDKTYDRVIISEDLEPFANNNYDTIDKFLFDKLDNISDEAIKENGENIDIVLICTDRRNKADDMLVKLFGIGIYNAIIGQDRSVNEVCNLINKPRSKKEAKQYYKIEADNVNYQSESENNVSEAEVQNILAHYKRLGRNEDKYVDSFNNIVSQYTDIQLKIIIKYLPMNVKAVLEEKSQKYQELVTFSNDPGDIQEKARDYKIKKEQEVKEGKFKIELLERHSNKTNMSKPILIPTGLNGSGVKKFTREDSEEVEQEEPIEEVQEEFEQPEMIQQEVVAQPEMTKESLLEQLDALDDETEEDSDDEELDEVMEGEQASPEEETIDLFSLGDEDEQETAEQLEEKQEATTELEEEQEVEDLIDKLDMLEEMEEVIQEDVKEEVQEERRGRGRPKKILSPEELEALANKPKRGRGRPRKYNPAEEAALEKTTNEETNQEAVNLFNLDEETSEVQEKETVREEGKTDAVNLFDLDEEEGETLDNVEVNISQEDKEQVDISSFENNEDIDNNTGVNIYNKEVDLFSLAGAGREEVEEETNDIVRTNVGVNNADLSRLLTKDKKVVAFVGTSKNGTSFVVNNVAQLLSTIGISTAILDMTKNKNAYYIYTKNEESLRKKASDSIYRLKNGVAEGIRVNKHLTIYTDMPGEEKDYSDVESILSTLIQNYSLVLIDCDFDTNQGYFAMAQEIFLIQSMDVLTIQPLTLFLRNLKSRNLLKQEKIKIVINKEQKMRNLPVKVLIGGMAYYNDPSMSFMTELFDKEKVTCCTIPFDPQVYIKYLEGMVDCEVDPKAYSKNFVDALRGVANVVYPLINRQSYSPMGTKETFSGETNDILKKMKRKF